MTFSLRQLEAFKAVAETGSVTQAAKSLNISQPAISRLIADFSQSIGVELFAKEGRNLVPTSEAKYLLSEVTRVFGSLHHLEELTRDISERKAGHIRIACLPGFATNHLPHVLAEFLKTKPAVTIQLEPDRPERILEWVVGEQYDLGITDGFSGHPAVETQDINIRTLCALPERHPLAEFDTISPLDLKQEKIIHTNRGSAFFKMLSNAFTEYGITLNSWIEVRQFSTACEIIREGQGVSIVSALDAGAFRGSGVVFRSFKPKLSHRLSLLKPLTRPQSLLVLDFAEEFIRSLRPYMLDQPLSLSTSATLAGV